jgi:plasmid stabilization system protein ParE
VKVELSGEARAEVERADAWWRENRPAAPDLFANELDQALVALEGAPGLGLRYEPKPGIRRLLLQRTSYHLYFLVQADRVYVVAVWSAYRGRGPAL